MTIIYRDEKGSALTADEADDNLRQIIAMIQDLQNNPPEVNDIESIELIGTTLRITLEDGTIFGPFQIPLPLLQFRGDWLPTHAYQALDEVRVPGRGLFLIMRNHTSDAEFDPDKIVSGVPAYHLLYPFYPINFGDLITEDADIDAGSANLWRDVDADGTGPIELTIQLTGDSDTPEWALGDTFTVEDLSGIGIEFIEGDGVVINPPGGTQRKTRSDHSTMTLVYKGDGVFTLSGDLLLV